MAFCANLVLGNLSNRKSYDKKLQDTWSIVLGVLGVLCKSQLGITSVYIIHEQTNVHCYAIAGKIGELG